MNEQKIQQLTAILKRLNQGENSAATRQEAQDFLAGVEPSELAMAEQELVNAGLKTEDLRQLCAIHIAMMSGAVKDLKQKLKPGHVIDTFINEHEIILDFLDKLEKVNQDIQKLESFETNKEEFALLRHIAIHLLEAELHHQREEGVLFPELEKRGLTAPPHIMRLEHEELRKHKQDLQKLSENIQTINFTVFKQQLNETVTIITNMLRNHIFKENSILYPLALEIIQDLVQWQEMKNACDKIGYCCFTPKM